MNVRRGVLAGIGFLVLAFALGNLVVMLGVGGVVLPRPAVFDPILVPAWFGTIMVAVGAAGVDEVTATRWLARRGVEPSPDAVGTARAWLRRTRTARAVGFASVLVVAAVPAWLVNNGPWVPGDEVRGRLLDLTGADLGLPAAILGYAVGALIAEATRRAAPADRGVEATEPRVADLRARSVHIYLRTFSRLGPRVVTGVTVLALLLTRGQVVEGTLDPLWLVAAVITLLVANEAAAAWVIHRRQRTTTATLLAVDDAARATTVHAVSGSVMGIVGTLLADHLAAVSLSVDAGLSGVAAPISIVVGVAAFLIWLGHGVELAHTVRRTGVGRGTVADPTVTS